MEKIVTLMWRMITVMGMVVLVLAGMKQAGVHLQIMQTMERMLRRLAVLVAEMAETRVCLRSHRSAQSPDAVLHKSSCLPVVSVTSVTPPPQSISWGIDLCKTLSKARGV